MAISCKTGIFLCFLCFCCEAAFGVSATDSLMDQLGIAIADRGEYLRRKETRLSELRAALQNAGTDRERFDALTDLYCEYHPFNADSTYSIVLEQEAVANRIGDSVLTANSRMNLANLLSAVGMYHETLGIMEKIKPETLPEHLHGYYYHIMRTVYGRLADYAAFEAEREKYTRLTNEYRDSIMAANDAGSLAHIITKADSYNISGKPREAIGLLTAYMAANELPEHDKAICAWTLSESYRQTGDRERRKEMLLISSISDLKSCVREYISLRELAMMLYEEGDLNRAYELLNIAVDDATKCNARQRIVELNNCYPQINTIYVDEVKKQKNNLTTAILIITVLAVILVLMLVNMRKQMLRVSKARSEAETAYARLNEVTEQLKATNESLRHANNEIAEISRLKEVYIGQYMDQCVSYIDALDTYRKAIGKLVSAGKTESIKKAVNSTTIVDEQLKSFYAQFDRTFLNLFPSFVEDFNSLLLPEEAIVPKKDGTLNPELRIFALIRLGITDSDKIAKFLRYSLTTIYNYRTKVRNKSRGDRNQLEQQVLKIGRR